MMLSTLLKQLSSDKKKHFNVKIKCEDGSSFFYCGLVKKCDEDMIKRIDKKYVDYYEQRIERTMKKSAKAKYKSILKNRKPFWSRPVVEVYDGILPEEAPCKIIVVKGAENGKYWTIAEFNRGFKL